MSVKLQTNIETIKLTKEEIFTIYKGLTIVNPDNSTEIMKKLVKLIIV